jgi:small conductance mechanosensitive channel
MRLAAPFLYSHLRRMLDLRLPRPMTIRVALVLAALIAAFVAAPSRAQMGITPEAAKPPAAASKSHAATTDKVSAADLQKLLATLQNPQQRAQLVDQLRALLAAQTVLNGPASPSGKASAAPAKKTSPAATTAAVVQKSMPALVQGLATRFESIGAELVAVAGIARGAPHLVRWVEAQAASPEAREQGLDTALRLLIVFAAAALAGFATAWLLRALRRRIGARYVTADLGRWLVLFVGMLVLELVPLGVFAAMATLVLAAIHPGAPARAVAAIAIGAILRAQLILIVLRVLLVSSVSPHFLRLGAETRTYLYLWARRFVVWTFYGFGVAEILVALEAPHSVSDLVLRLTVIVLAGLAVVFVLQNRAPIAAELRVPPDRPARYGRTSLSVRMVRNALADTWHILALVYIVGSFGAYLVYPASGVGFVLRATLISLFVLLCAFAAVRLVHRLDGNGIAFGSGFRVRHPGLEARLNKYVPSLVFIISALIDAAAMIVMLQVWGVDAVDWLERQYVRSLTGTFISIAIVVALAIVVWEMVNAGVERALRGGDPRQQAQVSARLRTLLPLIRTTVLIAIVTIAGFIVLSQIGVNIAPLLAGAGIVGIAVGFGSQQLVHDVINGLFILIENTVTIGDWVDVGGGHAGAVEVISIRSMRLRDGSGAVHTVPYSSVAAVTNTNRGIGNAGFSLNIAFGEDTDKVARLLIELGAEMRREAPFKTMMLSEFQLFGIDKVDAATVTMSGQIVCTDAGRWPVQREFNRRIMKRFQAEGIAFAVPTQQVLMRDARDVPEVTAAKPQVTALRAPRDRG